MKLTLSTIDLVRLPGLRLFVVARVRAGGASSRIADHWVKYRPTPQAGAPWYKDLALALEYAHELGAILPGAAVTQQMLEKLLAPLANAKAEAT